ncbi:hypothetical protein [Terrisporobacter mayombei]|uniref:Membrane-spanning protein n=1 Tax=Terrisporobacter mayombei TaxID=1541 RepID=A0ABY9PVZ1_9FIRM|nr:hypothetical protein [Terrisporobacter mayombei]MCC3869963.1 hypothetical protein [Terrisporobacter mayombei]WMT79853.1 hypothetical protein TEMA_01230 [Terrisporobacter mayombei]
MKKINILKCLNMLLCLFYGLSVVYLIFIKKYNYAAICAGCIILTYILRLANKKFDYLFNDMLIIMLDLFILFSLVLGTSYGLYKINYYDDILHIWSGAIGSVVAYTIINVCTKKEDRKNIKKVFFFIFIFMFSLGIANLWEILEFTLDLLFKINCQAGGLKDTMIDMVDGLIGTLIITPFLLRRL